MAENNNDELDMITSMFPIFMLAFMMQSLFQPPTPQPPVPPAPGAGLANLYGLITDATGAPLAGVRVNIGGFEGIQYTTTVNPSDSTGYYLIADCGVTGSGITLPGTYSVTFSKAGYQAVGGTIDLVEGNNVLNAQLAPIVQLEMNIAGGVIIGINGQPFVEQGQLQADTDYFTYGADGTAYGLLTMQKYTPFVKLAAPIQLADLKSLTLNIICRTLSVPGYTCMYDILAIYLPQPPVQPPGLPLYASGAEGTVGVPSALPANLDLNLICPTFRWPTMSWVAGVTYDLRLVVDAYADSTNPRGSIVWLIKNAVRCISTGP